MGYASFEDVANRFERELPEELRTLVETRLADTEGMIRRRIPDLDAQVASDPGLAAVVVRVCADAVLRMVRNPEGFVQETDGNYTYMLSQALAGGRLAILRDEWRDLGVSSRVGVVHVTGMRGWGESIRSVE